jgi:hypothetical protein
MDYGPFLSATITANFPSGNTANKGVAIHLGKDAACCFDTDLLRVSAYWTGEFLQLNGTPFDGGHGSHPRVKGTQLLGTAKMPGWARPGTDDFKDPRLEPYGPLPRDWARFKGLYLSGNDVVLSYTVGDCRVIEHHRADKTGDDAVFYRTLNRTGSTQPLTMLLCEARENKKQIVEDGFVALGDDKNMTVVVLNTVHGEKLVVDGKRILLKVPAGDKGSAFRLRQTVAAPAAVEKLKNLAGPGEQLVTLRALMKGGPSRWKETVTTKGTLGTGTGPYVVDTITPPETNTYESWMRFGGFDFFSDGRAALCTWSGDVWIVSGIDAKLDKLVWKRFATGLFQPLGLKIVDDKVYTLGREGIVRLHDLDGDGEADFYETFNNDVATTPGFHEFAFDLQTDAEGNFYYAKAGPVRGGGSGFEYIAAHSGCLMKVSKDGMKHEVFATGFRAPNGIGVGPDGTVTSGDNEGTWTPMCRLSLVAPGSLNGCVDTYHKNPRVIDFDRPICWLPKNIDNSNGGQCWVTSDRWGPLKGQLLHTSYGTSSLYHVLLERDGKNVQGGVVKFPLKFDSGIMRPRFSALDGQLYVCGLRGWQTNAPRDAAFQRVRYTGKPLNSVVGMKVIKGGLELTFSEPLDPKSAGDAENYSASWWNYLWRVEYGSRDYSAADPDYFDKMMEYNRLREDRGANKEKIETLFKSFKPGRDKVAVKGAKLSADGKTVTLDIPEMKPVMQMHLRYKVKTADGAAISQEIYSTVNRLPK